MIRARRATSEPPKRSARGSAKTGGSPVARNVAQPGDPLTKGKSATTGDSPPASDVASAGDFAKWAVEMKDAIRGERPSQVPCGTCTACCTASQFVHIGPDETDALAHIPKKLVFPAPGLPRGHVLLGYDEHGHCPMLVAGRCSIYEHRPRTCRTYDCRIFPATGLEVDGNKVLIARQSGRWQFSYPMARDQVEHDALRAAAAFLREHADDLPPEAVPAHATPLAVLAVELHELFLRRDEEKAMVYRVTPTLEEVREALLQRRKAPAARDAQRTTRSGRAASKAKVRGGK